mmetsp:Transcript_27291/g.62815  ORF Transcript_27291/g.62815 Transcript_27291/m.62815 type:complete len:113 (-) Transcript_27291:36-374(-)
MRFSFRGAARVQDAMLADFMPTLLRSFSPHDTRPRAGQPDARARPRSDPTRPFFNFFCIRRRRRATSIDRLLAALELPLLVGPSHSSLTTEILLARFRNIACNILNDMAVPS